MNHAPQFPRPVGPIPLKLAVAGLAGLLAASVLAAQPRGSASPPPARPATGAVELADEPFRLESVGLTVRLPVHARAESTRIGGRATAQITPDHLRYLINIQTPETSNPNATVKEAADQTLALIQGHWGQVDPRQVKVVDTEAVLLERTGNLALRGGVAERIYMSVPALNQARIVKGYTIFKPSDRQFVVFELITGEADFKDIRGVYETIVATAEFADPYALAAERGQAVLAGAALIGRLVAQDYESVLDDKERWYRIAQPAATGNPADADEVGYRSVRFWRGKRGEISPDKPMSRWNQTDRQEGYLARVRARILQGTDVYDSDAIYFMTPDRREEAWSITMVVRERTGQQKGIWKEIGARDDDRMVVSIDQTGQPGRQVRPHVENQGYLTQVESYMLPHLLIRSGVETEFGFYTYRTQSETIALRRDTLSRDAASGGAWGIKTLFREDAPAQTAVYNDAGELIRADLGNGNTLTPIEPERLMRLWSTKGLPTGPLNDRRR